MYSYSTFKFMNILTSSRLGLSYNKQAMISLQYNYTRKQGKFLCKPVQGTMVYQVICTEKKKGQNPVCF